MKKLGSFVLWLGITMAVATGIAYGVSGRIDMTLAVGAWIVASVLGILAIVIGRGTGLMKAAKDYFFGEGPDCL